MAPTKGLPLLVGRRAVCNRKFAAALNRVCFKDTEITRDSGNVFGDLGLRDAGKGQLRALLAARIIGVLDERKLTVQAAQEQTGGREEEG